MSYPDRRNALSMVFASLLCAGALSAPRAMASGKKAEKKKGGGEAFIQFPVIAVFVPAGYRNGTLTMELGLDVPDEKLRAVVTTYIPRLRDAYVSRIQAYAMTLGGSKLVDTDYIQRELQTITNTQLKANGAKLLLGSIMVN